VSIQPNGHRPVSRFTADDSDVIVVIGSGAGGGTLASELCQKGAKVVLIEAGEHYQPEDFINDEWASLNQLAWLDERTTSGSWRIAEEFPNLPAWTCKAVGGTTVHWAGCCPRFTGISSARLYWENTFDFFGVKNVNIPAAVTVFPKEIYKAPRNWAERAYPKLIYFNEVDRGCHFAAWQEPTLFTAEVRAAFRSLR
jgi:choline dehydrogenase-like flavoprotein